MINQLRMVAARGLVIPLVFGILMASVTGCATYRAARLPGESSLAAEDGRQKPQLFVGATARVVLPDGEKSAGEITALTDSTFTIGRLGNFGVEGRTLTRSEVAVLEMEDQASFGSVTKAALTGLGFLVVFLGVLFVTQLPSD